MPTVSCARPRPSSFVVMHAQMRKVFYWQSGEALEGEGCMILHACQERRRDKQ
jgi:hypothetical protein